LVGVGAGPRLPKTRTSNAEGLSGHWACSSPRDVNRETWTRERMGARVNAGGQR